ncbi:uncharacterized protein CTRU02_200014 [Colletotrichum truncatum]|uniref:Uncharacterized protein n=1 Tax=Colletotrichum truncatum TaxID=5467 RepID=A0ACC3ZDC3_COLTU|nr:uncharacterized protein CTRU02_04889 [Colletotrichum truncatum]KAF6794688.1 hypothetical protein CTRU02_04889 [Colletotrichum truncatum]
MKVPGHLCHIHNTWPFIFVVMMLDLTQIRAPLVPSATSSYGLPLVTT